MLPPALRTKGSNLALHMNIHLIEEQQHIGPSLIIEPEDTNDECKMKLIHYEKKLLNEKKTTQTSKDLSEENQPDDEDARRSDDQDENEAILQDELSPKQESERTRRSSSMQSFI